ncbi:MAG: hypothetical protein CMF62_02465 [Magnetococcales bacterium]|nr:hypothetical protein [Magnetococcales bacterium]|tara:strand:- start:15009 stop:16649 length:1641 start_codon:yes stop_codon:yes gene_type:complete
MDTIHNILKSQIKDFDFDIIKQNKVNKITYYNKDIKYNWFVSSEFEVLNNGTSPLDQHLYRLIKNVTVDKTLNQEQIFELVNYLISNFESLQSYCTICGTKLKFKSYKITTCENDDCKMKKEILLVDDNYVIDSYKSNIDQFIINIRTIFEVIKNGDPLRFEPFPYIFHKKNELKKRDKFIANKNDYHLNKDIASLQKLILGKTPENIIEIIEHCVFDLELKEKLGHDLYRLIKFAIETNNTQLLDFKVSNGILNEMKLNKFPEKMKIFAVKHSKEKEDYFKKDSIYCFHGSGTQNWYSILRNGLKNVSNTNMMTAGAALGAGIYLGKSSGVSLNYSNGSYKIMGICLLKNHKNYDKSRAYVVPNEKDILLKYIVCGNLDCVFLDKYFTDIIYKNNSISDTRLTKIATKRIIKELKNIKKKKKINNIDVMIYNNDLTQWNITMKVRDIDLNLEMILGDNYPLEPPHIHLISPKVKSNNGYIGNNGSICIGVTSNKHWKPIYSLEMVLLSTKFKLEDDLIEYKSKKKYNTSISIEEYQEICKRMNWI